MALTLSELKEKLADQFDEIALIEMLGISCEDILEAFEDRVIGKFTHLENEIE